MVILAGPANISRERAVYIFERPSQPLTILLRAPTRHSEPYFFARDLSVPGTACPESSTNPRATLNPPDARVTPTAGPIGRGFWPRHDRQPDPGTRSGSGPRLLFRRRECDGRLPRRLSRPQPRPRSLR